MQIKQDSLRITWTFEASLESGGSCTGEWESHGSASSLAKFSMELRRSPENGKEFNKKDHHTDTHKN